MKFVMPEKKHFTFPIAIVVSRFNEEITRTLLQGALDRLRELNFPDVAITVVWVPGAIEIPLVVQRLAKRHEHHAIVCLGAVIRGETVHFDYVCRQVSEGCQQVMLQYDIPVIFEVLMTEDESQALARAGGAQGNRGRDAIDIAVDMVAVLQQLVVTHH